MLDVSYVMTTLHGQLQVAFVVFLVNNSDGDGIFVHVSLEMINSERAAVNHFVTRRLDLTRYSAKSEPHATEVTSARRYLSGINLAVIHDAAVLYLRPEDKVPPGEVAHAPR